MEILAILIKEEMNIGRINLKVMIRHKKAEIVRDGQKYIMILPYSNPSGDQIAMIIKEYSSLNSKVLILTKRVDGTNEYIGINSDDINVFSSRDSFDNLQWEEGSI
jgi:hypothetical protein